MATAAVPRSNGGPPPDAAHAAGFAPPAAASALVAPAAIRVIDLAAPVPDLLLPPGRSGAPYRSLLAIARLDGHVVGTVALPVDPGGHLPRERLASGLREQLEPELRAALSELGMRLPGSLPRSGLPRRYPRRRRVRVSTRSVSVVVTTCGRPEAVARCVGSVLDCGHPDAEIIVVDNRPGSGRTEEMIRTRFAEVPGIRYVEEHGRGASRARNAGLAVAEGEVVAFLDDDVVVDPRWFDHCLQAFDAAGDVACVTGLILPLTLESTSQVLLEQFASFGKGYRRKLYRLPEASERDPLFPYTAGSIGSGANMALLREAAQELGGFDTVLGPGTPATGAEDLDLYVRVLRAGHSVVYEPDAIVRHEHPRGMRRLGRHAYRYGVGMGALLGKQIVAGPDRAGLVRAVPAGARYVRDPESRKNAGKPADFPRRLTRLERLGLAIGPLAYLVSLLWSLLCRPLDLVRGQVAPATSFTAWHLPRGGRPLELRVFVDGATDALGAWLPAPAAKRAPPRPAVAAPTQQPLLAAAAAACVLAPLLVVVGAPVVLRLPAVLALMCLAPGTAFVAALGRRAEAGLVVGVSLGVTVVVAQCMLWLGVWEPTLWLVALAVACLPALVPRLDIAPLRAVLPGATVGGARLELPEMRHAVYLAGALVAWAIALAGTDVDRIAGLGLLDALPFTYYVAIGLLLAGFVRAATSERPSPGLLGIYVIALIVVLHGTTALLYDEPRYPWTYKHLGVIELIGSTGHVDREIDIYHNWPAFFAANAWFSSVVGLKPIAYAAWAQVFFNVASIAALRFALRALTRNEMVLWTAAALFVLGNWVGQDYLAPQALGFVLSLVVLGLCLRLEINRRAACLAGAVCFLAVLLSHQLSPVMLIASVTLLWLVARRVPLWVPVAMVVVEAWWVSLSWPFVESHFNLIDVGSGGAATDARNVGEALSGAVFGFYAPAAVMLAVTALAVVGGIRMLRHKAAVRVPACLVLGPVAIAVIQRYGGEGAFRAYLFSLPWLAFFGAWACVRASSWRAPVRMDSRRLTTAAAVLSVFLLFAYFGQELVNHITRSEVRVAAWYERNAPAGSGRLELAPSSPQQISARYPHVTLADMETLLDRPEFRGRRLGRRDLPRIERLIRNQGPDPTFVVLTRLQNDFARLNGLLPPGSMASLVRALSQSPHFRPVYRRPGAWIFEPREAAQ